MYVFDLPSPNRQCIGETFLVTRLEVTVTKVFCWHCVVIIVQFVPFCQLFVGSLVHLLPINEGFSYDFSPLFPHFYTLYVLCGIARVLCVLSPQRLWLEG